jgi:hypothetical protein
LLPADESASAREIRDAHVAKPQRSQRIYPIDKIGQKGTLRKDERRGESGCGLPIMAELTIRRVVPSRRFSVESDRIGQPGRVSPARCWTGRQLVSGEPRTAAQWKQAISRGAPIFAGH